MSELPPNPVEVGLHCPNCDYNLTGATGGRCPWCGSSIDLGELTANRRPRLGSHRWSLAVAAFAIGGGLLVVLASLLPRGSEMSLRDAFTVLAVLVAGLGHISLAGVAAVEGGRWPMRPGTAGEIIRLAGWLALAAGVLGATAFLESPSSPRSVRGVQVGGFLVFVVMACLYSLPGCMLLVLRMVSFRGEETRSRGGRLRRNARSPLSKGRATFEIDVVGRYTRNQLTQSRSDERRRTTPELDALIAQTWKEQLAQARKQDRLLYDGKLARFVSHQASPETLHLELGATCYREFVGTNLYNAGAALEIGADCLADPVGISSTVITRDGHLALGRRASSVAFHAGFLHTFGGLLESADELEDGSYDVFGAALRELTEELCIRSDEIADIVIVGMVRDFRIHQPELLFDVTISLSREELVARFDPGAMDQEHTGIEFVRDAPEAIPPFLTRSEPVAPVAQAALLLHGRNRWGVEWYERSCRACFGEIPRLADLPNPTF